MKRLHLIPVFGITTRVIFIIFITAILPTEEVKSQNYVLNYTVLNLDPQSIVYHPAKKQFIVSSNKQGLLGYLDDEGKYTQLIKHPLLRGASRMVIRNNILYVLTNSSNSPQPPRMTQSHIIKIDLRTKTIVSATPIGKLHPTLQNCTDLAIDDTGSIYILDVAEAVIHKLKPDSTSTVLLANPLLSKGKSIIYHINGYLLAAIDRDLYKIDLSDNSLSKVYLEVGFDEINTLRFTRYHLLILAEGGEENKVHILNSSNSWRSANLLRTDTWTYINPNSIEFVNNKIYVLDSHIKTPPDLAVSSGDFSVHVTDLQKRPRQKKRRGTVTVGEAETTIKNR